MFSNGTIINGNFHILAPLGSGGMGAVFKAFDNRRSRVIALKFLHRDFSMDPASVSRFRQEGEILATIRHPRIVEVFSLETDEKSGLPFMVMEFFPGESLMKFHNEFSRNPARLINVFLDLLDGVQAFHAKNIIHRDLKPANILINEAGDLKIVDFGIAKGSRKQTQTGMALGTPHYMSPEQCEGMPNITYRSDIYSLGIVLWELLTGSPPFEAPEDASDAFLAIVMKHLITPPPIERLQKNPTAALFSDLLAGMLEKKPAKRPDIDAIIRAFQDVKEKLLNRTDSLSMRFPLGLLLQRGPFGEFRQSLDTKTNTQVLVQVIQGGSACPEKEIAQRLERLREVRHPGVCRIIHQETDRREERHLLVMESPDGQPLTQAWDSLGQDHNAASLFMLKILEELAAIHERGVIHGNLNPAFIGIGEKSEARISGFPMSLTPQLNREKSGAGGKYLAPEQWKGGPLTAATDIYSAGLIFWELLFKQLPASLSGTGDVQATLSERTVGETMSMRTLSPQNPLFSFLEHLMEMIRPDPASRPALADLLAVLGKVRSAFHQSAPKMESRESRQCLLLTKDETLVTLFGVTMKEFDFRFRRAGSYDEIARLSSTELTVAWFIDLDGFFKSVPEITSLALKAAPEAKVVFLATRFTREIAEECMGQMANGLLAKPLVVPRLVQTLNSLSEEPELVESEHFIPLRAGESDVPSPELKGNPHHILFFECGVCKERFGTIQYKPGAFECHATDTDFCPVCREGINPEMYAVVVCPFCLYANFAGRFQRSVFSPDAVEKFLEESSLQRRMKIAQNLDFQNERTLTEGVRSFELAALAASELEPLEYDRLAAGIFLKTSWLCRRQGKPLMETYFQARALESIMQLYPPYLLLSSRFPGWEAVREKLKAGQILLSERAVLVNGFLGAELSARLGLDEQADFYFDKVFGLPFLSRFPQLARHVHTAFRKFKDRLKETTAPVI